MPTTVESRRSTMATTSVADDKAYASSYEDSSSDDDDDQGVKLDWSSYPLATQAKSEDFEDEKSVVSDNAKSVESAVGKSPSPNKIEKGVKVERYSPPYVRNGQRASSEKTTSKSPSTMGSDRTSRSLKLPRGADVEHWRTIDSAKVVPDAPSGADFKVKDMIEAMERENRYKHQSAQSIYPPSSCVFVANLLSTETDKSLEVAVTKAFRGFGSVYVKIRRDPKQMPFAFCQFTRQDHAESAIRYGNGNIIFGRPCRCEKAKAHRLFSIQSRYGPLLTPLKARQLMEQFGEIEDVRIPSDVERARLDLSDSILVQFFLYDDGQNAFNALRNHPEYKIECLSKYGKNKSLGDIDVDADDQYLARYDVDRRSIFIGNLPRHTTETEVRDLFGSYGKIMNVSIHTRPSRIELDEDYAFAFVEFHSPTSLHKAVSGKHATVFGSKILKVHPKDSESSRKPHRSQTFEKRHRSAPTPAIPIRGSAYQVNVPNVPPTQTYTPTYAPPPMPSVATPMVPPMAPPVVSPVAPPIPYGYSAAAPWFDGHQWFSTPAWALGNTNSYGSPLYGYSQQFPVGVSPPGLYHATSPTSTNHENTEGSPTAVPDVDIVESPMRSG